MTLIQSEFLTEQILLLKINRKSAMNAFSDELIEAFHGALDQIGEARVLIITGSGDKAFSAGADLKERKKLKGRRSMARGFAYSKACSARL